jgi:FkbM family methyltransferase
MALYQRLETLDSSDIKDDLKTTFKIAENRRVLQEGTSTPSTSSAVWHFNASAPKLGLESSVKRSDNSQIAFMRRLKSWGFYPDVILDVGANRGEWAADADYAFSNDTHRVRILCIEASVDRKEHLMMQHPYEVTIAVVGSKSGPVQFYNNPRAHTGNSIFVEKSHHFADTKPMTVMMHRIDDLIAQKSTKDGKPIHPKLIKVDIQGT